MFIKLKGGKVYDPAHNIDGEIRDIYIVDGKITETLPPDTGKVKEYDINGMIVMSGAIDMHTHIGGGKVNIARLMMLENQPADYSAETLFNAAAPATLATGYRYAEMGYTACFEPAVLPINARQAHMEMADTPIIDTGGYVMLGNNDILMEMIARNADQQTIQDFVAWILHTTQCIGIKIVNPGGISAFKFNQRKLDVDQKTPHYQITPRRIVECLAQAVDALGIPHPLHVHASNLGVAGNVNSTLETVKAANGHRIHLAHVQFHSYGTEGKLGFSSAAAQIAELINNNPHITTDIGQIMFGQTVTTSGDSMSQYAHHQHASPKKWMLMDIECEAGCGIVPFHYQDKKFINALQWAIGLELFLMIKDPWRVFLTTDHPNGAPFISYPHLIRLLMDRSYRNDMLTKIHPYAAEMSHLSGLDREYSLYEIAIMTRAAPAKILGLDKKGHLGDGADADVVVYRPDRNPEIMFAHPLYVFKNGELVVENNKVKMIPRSYTHTVKPEFDKAIEKQIKPHFDKYRSIRFENTPISNDEMAELIGSPVIVQPCHTP